MAIAIISATSENNVIGKDNVAGAQFHPERSGKTGARLLQNFLEWQL
jgi:glutamine amidotransferase